MLPYFMSLQVKFQIYIDLSIFSVIRKVLFTSTTDPKYYYRPSAGRALRTIYFLSSRMRSRGQLFYLYSFDCETVNYTLCTYTYNGTTHRSYSSRT